MAKPRIFISSTYYDLKNVRADLERFVREMGYDPILNERGHIPYGKEKSLEEYCYREVGVSDILVSIVGNRAGTLSSKDAHTISQLELKTALELGKQVYVFVDRDVTSEYRTYSANKGKSIEYVAVDNPIIYEFLEYIYGLPNNNSTFSFETSADITQILREQWAGLFQDLLNKSIAEDQAVVARELSRSLDTVRRIISQYGSGKARGKSVNLELLDEHPAYRQLQRLFRTNARIYFKSINELNAWMKDQDYKRVTLKDQDDSDVYEWINRDDEEPSIVKVNSSIFENNGDLKQFTSDSWDENWISRLTKDEWIESRGLSVES